MVARRWQFSIRNLLLLTAALSVFAAVAVNVPGFILIMLLIPAPALILVAIVHSANFLFSDRRPILAAILWSLFAGFFVLLAAEGLFVYIAEPRLTEPIGTFLWFGVMSACCLVGTYRAYRSLREVFRR